MAGGRGGALWLRDQRMGALAGPQPCSATSTTISSGIISELTPQPPPAPCKVHVLAASAEGDVAANTSTARDLTPAPCEVQDWSRLSAAGELYIASNCDNVDALGVARLDVASGQLPSSTSQSRR